MPIFQGEPVDQIDAADKDKPDCAGDRGGREKGGNLSVRIVDDGHKAETRAPTSGGPDENIPGDRSDGGESARDLHAG